MQRPTIHVENVSTDLSSCKLAVRQSFHRDGDYVLVDIRNGMQSFGVIARCSDSEALLRFAERRNGKLY